MIREVTGCLFCFARLIHVFLNQLKLAETQQSLKLKSSVFGSNAETIQEKDYGQKLNLLSSSLDVYTFIQRYPSFSHLTSRLPQESHHL